MVAFGNGLDERKWLKLPPIALCFALAVGEPPPSNEYPFKMSSLLGLNEEH